ncbi:hypothetical protein PBI_PIPEFISH_77 [Mycobacterium phage Pipefish]|uniref:Uncharacterized protein n=1 Tax=Mycobacterium phage Pipefish TaxID=373413 RepID=Q19YS8_9CAUD|nr:gp77 [Mycobacterium phage Pipefish]ABD58574.1 hypothetical protein PBI_PIPEFISH_77 [Mycobacterium phage Pipefish]
MIIPRRLPPADDLTTPTIVVLFLVCRRDGPAGERNTVNTFVIRNAAVAARIARAEIAADLAADGIETVDDLNAAIDAHFA